MQVGLNAGFGDPLGGEFNGLATYGFARIRQDVFAHTDMAEVIALVREFAGAPVVPLFLIGGGHISYPDGSRIAPAELADVTLTVVQAAQDVGLVDYQLEIGNEPDIACPAYSEHPDVFAEAVGMCHNIARAAGFTGPVISGGIANLNNRGFRYLRQMLEAPGWPPTDDMVVGFHRYPEAGRGPWAPHDHFTSRQDEMDTLLRLADGRPVACTEFGYHTAPRQDPITLTDDDVAGAVMWDLAFYERNGATLGLVYQLNDGPTEAAIDRYGVRALDGVWKPVADAIRAEYTG